MEVEDADGVKTTVWPMIYAVVTDWQEGCVAAGTKSGNKTNCPCHTCLVLACDLDDLAAGRRAELRTEKRMKQIYDQVVKLHAQGGCNAVIESLVKGWSVNPVEVRCASILYTHDCFYAISLRKISWQSLVVRSVFRTRCQVQLGKLSGPRKPSKLQRVSCIHAIYLIT
jgi:hypothetical protein